MRVRARTLALLLPAWIGLTAVGRETGPAAAAKLWSGIDLDFITGDISPDGRYLSDIDWASGDLQMIDLRSGRARGLTGKGYSDGGYAWTSAFSNDGRRIAVAWYRDRTDAHELRVHDLDGTAAQVVVAAMPDRYYVEPVDWSASDDEILVAIQGPTRTWQLALVAVPEGTLRVVTSLEWQTPGGGHDQAYPDADLSPDGRYVAYDYPHRPDAATRDIFAVAVDGGRRTILVTGPASDRLLGWLPDGGGILFYSNRGGTPAIWRVAVRDGVPSGEPRLVEDDVRALVPLGFIPDGYAYGVATESERMHTVAVNPELRRVVGLARPVPDPAERKSLAGDWSPDGTRLAYVRHDALPDPRESLVIVAAGDKVEREIPLTPALHASNGTLRWCANGRVFLYAYERGRPGIYEIDLGSGARRRLPVPDTVGRAALKWFDVSPDGGVLYLIGRPVGERGNQLLAFDVATAALRVLGEAPVVRAALEVSPDGLSLAFLARDMASGLSELRVAPAARPAEVRTLYRASRETLAPPIVWMPDGSQLVVGIQEGDGAPGLWTIDVRDGRRAAFMDGCCRENDARVSRDGRKLAFAAGVDRGDVRVVKPH